MSNQNRDPHLKKMRNLKRAIRSYGKWKLFEIYHPDFTKEYKKYSYYLDKEKIYNYYNTREDWIKKIAGGTHYHPAPPASFRRDCNKKNRSRVKQQIREYVRDDNLDEIILDKQIRTIRWDYW